MRGTVEEQIDDEVLHFAAERRARNEQQDIEAVLRRVRQNHRDDDNDNDNGAASSDSDTSSVASAVERGTGRVARSRGRGGSSSRARGRGRGRKAAVVEAVAVTTIQQAFNTQRSQRGSRVKSSISYG